METKRRYEILDGLRGVAAIMVVIFHLSEAFSYDPVYKHLNHGYLCVDFFFVLSGFVIGHAYQRRMASGQMTRWEFLKARLIRLQPMVLMGILLGASLFFFQESSYYPGIESASIGYVLLNMLMSFFMIPITPEWNVRGNEELFLLNIPQWSMVFEYIANILFCIFVYKLGKRGLMVLVAIFGVMLADSALTLNLFGFLQAHDYPCSLNAGWSLTSEQFYIGVARVGYSFFGGLLLYNLLNRQKEQSTGNAISGYRAFTLCSIIVIGIVCVEQIGGYEHPLYDGIFNLACVGVVCPLTVLLGARAGKVSEKMSKVCDFLGRLSYPLYLAHYPLVYLFLVWMDTHHEASFMKLAFVSVGTFVLSLAIAYAAMKLWDEPVRRWLARGDKR
ncbi:MAG: acyltransferase [Bacteroidia bacterium]|nr:acyltransferase [Bacteroidia bacterium]